MRETFPDAVRGVLSSPLDDSFVSGPATAQGVARQLRITRTGSLAVKPSVNASRPLIRLEIDFSDNQGLKAVLIDPVASGAARNPSFSFGDDDFWAPARMAENLASALQEAGYPATASVVDAATAGGAVGVSRLAGRLVETYQLYSVAAQQARYFSTGPGADSGLFGVFAGFSALRGMDRTTGDLVTRLLELPWTKVSRSEPSAPGFDVDE